LHARSNQFFCFNALSLNIARFPLMAGREGTLYRSGLASLTSQPRIPAMRFIERHLCRSHTMQWTRTVSSRSSRPAPQTETDQARKVRFRGKRRPRHNRAFGGAMKPRQLALKLSKVRRVLGCNLPADAVCLRHALIEPVQGSAHLGGGVFIHPPPSPF